MLKMNRIEGVYIGEKSPEGLTEWVQIGEVGEDSELIMREQDGEEKTYFDSSLTFKISDHWSPFTWVPPRIKPKPAPVFGLTKAQTKRRKANKAAKLARRKNRR